MTESEEKNWKRIYISQLMESLDTTDMPNIWNTLSISSANFFILLSQEYFLNFL